VVDQRHAGRWEVAGCVLAMGPPPRPRGSGGYRVGRGDHAKADQVRMARDVAGMFDELRALADRHAKLHADRPQLQAELERERAELEQVRPW
jgi:hypothetical protein